MSVTGAVISAVGGLIGDLFGTHNTNTSIRAQAAENQKNREWNLMLANKQNQWNIDQWNRENAYNSPAAQMARYQAAGLNPDLIYGQQTTSGQLSGSLTSGAPSTPADMSALLGKKSVLGGALERLGDGLMQLPMYREQVRKAKADADIAEADAAIRDTQRYEAEYDAEVHKFVRSLNFSPRSLESLLNYGAGNEQDFEGSLYNNPDVRKYLMEYSKLHDGFRISKETSDVIIDKAIADSQLAADEAEKVRRSLKSTIEAINANNKDQIEYAELERMLGVSNGVVQIIKIIRDILK